MPTLQERFADLAEDAPASPTPPGIWATGRRRARVRRLGTGVVVAATVLALAVLGGFAAYRSHTPPVAAQRTGGGALPTAIHTPSRWLSATSGPPGRLSMVIAAKKGTWTGYHWGAVGVSATTGTYGFLDIPGCQQVDGLSPDGTEVTCWGLAGPAHHRVLGTLFVYDTVTGHVERWVPSTGRIDLNSLGWDGSGALTFRTAGQSYRWQLDRRTPRPIGIHLTGVAGTTGRVDVYGSHDYRYFYLDPADPGRVHRIAVEQTKAASTATAMAVSPSGRQIAVTHLAEGSSALLVGTVAPAGHRTHVTAVPAASLHWPRIVGWADEQHVVVVNQVSPTSLDTSGDAPGTFELESVDVSTGATVSLASVDSGLGATWIDFARSYLAAPTRDYPAPPRPLDPRVEAGSALGVLLLAGAALLLWRRRVRA